MISQKVIRKLEESPLDECKERFGVSIEEIEKERFTGTEESTQAGRDLKLIFYKAKIRQCLKP